jgi:DNA-binding protein YbaB
VSFYDRMYALVSEIESNVAAMDQANAEALARPLTHEIEGGYGTVTVTGGGKLLAVDLDPRAIAGVRGAALGAAVTRAVRAAEVLAATRYQQQMAAATQQVSET